MNVGNRKIVKEKKKTKKSMEKARRKNLIKARRK